MLYGRERDKIQRRLQRLMPYILKNRREALEACDEFGPVGLPESAGELNYCITREIQEYVHRKGLSYSCIAEITGVLENVKQEFYRRIAGPYEDKKMQENGDVYETIGGDWT